MERRIECLRCKTKMVPGLVVDSTYGGTVQEQWAPGAPVSSFWSGLKIRKDELIPVTTMRCPKCGALESYARQ